MLSRRSFLWLGMGALATAWEAQSPPVELTPVPEVRLILGGDVMLGRYVGKLAREKQDPTWPFREIAEFMAGGDITFVNLEAPFCDRPGVVEKGMVFKAEPEMVEGLKLAGVDLVSTANNHARDRGDYGLMFTLEWLSRHDIGAVGTALGEQELRAGVVVERNSLRVGFLAYTYDQRNGNHATDDPRVACWEVEAMQKDVARLRGETDVVVVSMHGGVEYVRQPHASQVRFARAAIDAGALVVVGHHPHVTQEPEFYRKGLILYSLGNLVFDQFHREDTQRGWLAEVRVRTDEIVEARLHEVAIGRAQPRLVGESRRISAGGGGPLSAARRQRDVLPRE